MEPAITPEVLTPSVITPLEKLKYDIAILKEKDAVAKFDYRSTTGNKAARSHIDKMRGTKGDITRAHASAKAGVLELGRKMDALKTDLIGQVETLILPHQSAVDGIKKEEDDRRAARQAALDRIRAFIAFSPLSDSEDTKQAMADLSGACAGAMGIFSVDRVEDHPDITAAVGAARGHLMEVLAMAEQREKEAAELATLRAEAVANAERARVEKIQREAVEAERKRVEDAERSRLVREAEERARAEAAAERREQEAKLAQERAAREKAEAEARAQAAEARRLKEAEEARVRAEEDAKRAAQAEKDRQAEAARHAAEMEAEKKANADRVASWVEEQALMKDLETAKQIGIARAAEANREKVTEAIADAINRLWAEGADCRTIAHGLVTGEVPHVRIDWEKP